MKKFLLLIKNNILGFIFGAIIFGSIGYVVAENIAASNITYTNNNQSTVDGALNYLYIKAAELKPKGTKMYQCPDGTYQLNDKCTKPDITNKITYTTPCNCGYTYVCPSGTTDNGINCVCSYTTCTARQSEKNPDICADIADSCPSNYKSRSNSGRTYTMIYDKVYKNTCSYGTRTTTNSNSCPNGYTKTITSTSGTCNTVSGTCSSVSTCTTNETATCTAIGKTIYYCANSDTYKEIDDC